MTSVIEGKPDVVRTAVTVLLAEGHLLIEDVPGVGKTMLAKALARSIDCTVRRIQFTPDLLPSDVTGVSGLQPGRPRLRVPARARSSPTSSSATRSTAPRPRPSPRCWSRMEERQVTVDGTTYHAADRRSWSSRPRTRSRWRAPTPSPRPSATGSWPASRWATRRRRAEIDDARDATARLDPLDDLEPVTDAATISKLIGSRSASVHVAPGGAAVHRRPGAPRPAVHDGAAARRLAARRRCTCCGPRGRTPRSRAATTCSPTTCRCWPARCSPTGSCPSSETQLARRTTAEVVADLLRQVPVPPAAR